MRREHVLLPHADTFLEANHRIVSIASPAAQKALSKYLEPTSQIDRRGTQIPLSDLAG
jgi:Trk K+ transport system NAD-binding subunit